MREGYIPGDFWRICDRCGFKTRSSRTAKEWNGSMVCMECYEPRQPQDFVRGHADVQTVPDPRPEATDRFLGVLMTTTTAAAVAGATTLAVESSVRWSTADHIGVTLSDGSVQRAVLASVPSSTSLSLTAGTALAGAVSSGAVIVNYYAVATADLG